MFAEFTFAAATDITEIYVWNYTQGSLVRGIEAYEVFIDTGSGFGTTADYTGTLTQADINNHVAQNISFGTVENAVAIRLVGAAGASNSGLGLDEVLFGIDDTVAVPEPSSTTLLGLGTIALLARRKRS